MKRIIVLFLLIIPFSAPTTIRADTCTTAPPTRLRPGLTGIVTPGLVGLQLRALPAVGTGSVASMNGGTSFTAISGPSCNGGYNWWRVSISGDRIGWVAEATWEAYYLTPEWEDPPSGCNRGTSPWAHLFLAPLCYLTPNG